MRESTHVSYRPPAGGFGADQRGAQEKLAALSRALIKARGTSHCGKLLACSTRDELQRCSSSFKQAVCGGGEEHLYDLAALLDLVSITAFGAQHQREQEGLEFMQRTVEIARRQLVQRPPPERECSQIIKEVWTWLGSSRSLSARC